MSENGTRLTAFTIENLNAVGGHLFDHADAIANTARRDVAAERATLPTLQAAGGAAATPLFW
jgi:hypothetical protein